MVLKSDKKLVALVKLDDKQAFKELYMKYHARIYNFCMKLLTDKEEAKDIVQQVFTALWEQRQQIDENKPVDAYIYGMARYSVYQSFRKKVHQKAAVEYLINQPQQSQEMTFEDVGYKELEFYLGNLIDRLPAKRKKIFTLNRNKGLTYKEIAKLLNISENTVDTQMRKSLQFMRLEYEKHYKQ